MLWLHGYGNVFEKELAPHEQIDIEPGGWLYKDLGGFSLFMNRFTGPGKVALQSMYVHLHTGR